MGTAENDSVLRPSFLEATDFALLFGAMLLQSGASTARAVRVMHDVLARLGLPQATAIITPEAMTVISGDRSMPHPVVRPTPSIKWSIHKLGKLEAVVARVNNDAAVDLAQWRAELTTVDETPAPYGRWVLVAAYACSGFAISRLFKADWPGSVVAMLACATAQIVRATISSRFNTGVTTFITAMVASLFSTIGLRFHYSETIVPTLTSSVALLIPSLWLVTGGLDLMGGQIRFGMLRMVISFLIFATIVTGIAFALLIVTWGST